ncbi:hypothetical protein VTP01DRAFT_4863 [Rhizomucor pusillus]|uniref:uncharacterized protein n=1 Tax=Rhizomucor pusillus TaxID=4840 RepID=UPI0037440DF1
MSAIIQVSDRIVICPSHLATQETENVGYNTKTSFSLYPILCSIADNRLIVPFVTAMLYTPEIVTLRAYRDNVQDIPIFPFLFFTYFYVCR